MKNIQDYIIVDKFVEDSVSDSIVERFQAVEWEPHAWYSSAKDEETSRTEELKVLYRQNLPELLDPVKAAIDNYTQKIFDGIHCVTNFSSIRLNRYDVGCKIDSHADLIRRNQHDGIPVLTVLGVLNNDYTGGEFVMFNDTVIEMHAGDIMIFPATFLYPHHVRKVTSGTRYSFVTWVY